MRKNYGTPNINGKIVDIDHRDENGWFVVRTATLAEILDRVDECQKMIKINMDIYNRDNDLDWLEYAAFWGQQMTMCIDCINAGTYAEVNPYGN